MGIRVHVTSGNAYEVELGASAVLDGIAPVGELAVSVYSSVTTQDGYHWLGSFGNVEAVYEDGKVVMTAAGPVAEEPSAGTRAIRPWA